MDFVLALTQTLAAHASAENAAPMEKYMKHQFRFFGIKNENRKSLLKPLWLAHRDEIADNCRKIAPALMGKPQRELHYCGMEIFEKQLRSSYRLEDEGLIRQLIVTNSWWDSVDFLAKHVLGAYLTQFPEQTAKVVRDYSSAENMWLNRSAILFQLGYKKRTDAPLLFALCREHSGSNDFFIRKAIGWALREYAKIDAAAVIGFVAATPLSPLSKREALKNLQGF